MDQITHDVRTAQWAEIVRKCHERPDNQTAKEWLADYRDQRKTILLLAA